MTFTRYEQLRAMRRAALRLGLTRRQNEGLFHDTAVELIQAQIRHRTVRSHEAPDIPIAFVEGGLRSHLRCRGNARNSQQ